MVAEGFALMGEAKRRATVPALISVLIPERGRPVELQRLIRTLRETAGDDARYEIVVAIDDDDQAWPDPYLAKRTADVVYCWPRPITLGEKINFMARRSDGDIFLFLANDQVMVTEGWPSKIREAVDALPNGIGVPYLRDPMHPGHASYPVITRKMAMAIGFVMAPWPPYWFIDTWWDEVGILMDLHFEIGVEVASPDGRGKTHGMVDLAFWVEWFNALRPWRMRDAVNLANLAHGKGSDRAKDVMMRIGDRASKCFSRVQHMNTPEFVDFWSQMAESEPSLRYPEVKKAAEDLMAQVSESAPRRPKVAIAVPSGRVWEATTANCVAAMAVHTANHGIDVFHCNVQTSDISHGRNCIVELALKENVDGIMWIDSDMKFPPDALIRLMKHDKPVVGATYNRRVRNEKTGKFDTLGRLKGERPQEMGSGLYEALLLPGGMIYVQSKVYRKIGWPYYFNTFLFPGSDGLEGFKTMIRETLLVPPSEEILDGLNETALGEWLRGNYAIGDGNPGSTTFSEDLAFCKKARRHGFEIWCDLGLTYEVSHLGEFAVSCRPPEGDGDTDPTGADARMQA